MKTDSEKEKKLNFALNKLKNLNLQNPTLRMNLENLSLQKNQLEIEKKEIEEKYQNLLSEHKELNQKIDNNHIANLAPKIIEGVNKLKKWSESL